MVLARKMPIFLTSRLFANLISNIPTPDIQILKSASPSKVPAVSTEKEVILE